MKKNIFELGNSEYNKLGITKEKNKYDYDENSYIFDANKKNDGHTAVIRQITEKSMVLDIGCASGMIGSILKKHKDCIIDGIEYDKEAFKVAKNKNIYRNLYNFSITDLSSKEYKNFSSQKLKYDFIIFADVLEHLDKPWEVLVNMYPFLKENGSIIISVPNISHIDIIKGLINGNFNYTDLGILDSTHIRFFTANSFFQMVNNINDSKTSVYYQIELCEKVLIKPTYMENIEKYRLFNLNGNLENFLVLQNIFKLTKTKTNKQEKIVDNTEENYFEQMLDEFNRIYNMEKEIDHLKQENKKLKETYDKIINSKRWKIINDACNFRNKIFRSKGE